MCFRGAAVALWPVQQFRSNGFAPSTQDKGTKVDPTWVEALANRATDCWQRRARPRPQSRTAHVRIDLYQQPKANVLKTAIRLNRQKERANASAMIKQQLKHIMVRRETNEICRAKMVRSAE